MQGSKQGYIFASIASLLILLIGGSLAVHQVYRTTRTAIEQQLQADSKSVATVIDLWVADQKRAARALADDRALRALIGAVRMRPAGNGNAKLVDTGTQADAIAALTRRLMPVAESHGYSGYEIVGVDGRYLASDLEGLVGKTSSIREQPVLWKQLWAGEPIVTRPYLPQYGETRGAGSPNEPVIAMCAPVHEGGRGLGEVVAGLCFRMDPHVEFERLAASGNSG